jgi:hypothetical protein
MLRPSEIDPSDQSAQTAYFVLKLWSGKARLPNDYA